MSGAGTVWCQHGVVRRVVIIGNSGSGKSTLGARLAELLGAAHVELDALFHQPGWTRLDVDEFRRRVEAATAAERWVVDGNYRSIHELVWPRADTIIWIDLPRSVVMYQVLGRTMRRVARREELWNGNRESLRNVLSLDPERSIVAWTWSQHRAYREEYERLAAEGAHGDGRLVRLRSRRQVREWLVEAGDVG